jgi:cytidylate kinase
MFGTGTSDRLGESLMRAQLHWHTRHDAEGKTSGAPTPFTIAITRESGANGALVGKKLAERLGWPVYDRELLMRIADELGLRTQLLEGADEKKTNWLQEMLESFGQPTTVSVPGYVVELTRVVASLAARGECIMVGRGTAQVLPADTTLRVRLVAPVAHRVRVMQERHNLSREEAARRVAETDHARTMFVRNNFHKDPNDPVAYDLVLNSAQFTPDECAAMIIQALHMREENAKLRSRATPAKA